MSLQMQESYRLSRSSKRRRSCFGHCSSMKWRSVSGQRDHFYLIYCFVMSIVCGLLFTMALYQDYWGVSYVKSVNSQKVHFNLFSVHTDYGLTKILDCSKPLLDIRQLGTVSSDLYGKIIANNGQPNYIGLRDYGSGAQQYYFHGCDYLSSCFALSLFGSFTTLLTLLFYFSRLNIAWMLFMSTIAMLCNTGIIVIYENLFTTSEIGVKNVTGSYSTTVAQIFDRGYSYIIWIVTSLLQATCPISLLLALFSINRRAFVSRHRHLRKPSKGRRSHVRLSFMPHSTHNS